MTTEPQRTCASCGNELPGAMEFCPICMLRKGLAGGAESGESSASEDTVNPTVEQVVQRFEHYELVKGEEGKPVELGRGAMGITYKAFDADLRCSVALKVISERYLGDESARLRFLREARAAASVRHPNVASVFHLGRSGQNYFYAMEFVEGETLENLIKRSGRLEVMLALEITTQVAAGLAAVHKQKLVHRDVKPSNIMVSVEEGSTVTAKIIDLGLAKPAPDAPAEAAISTPGAFAGTPEFASPEQFAGVGVDIRSDLYSLGVTLWQMLTGQVPFRGSPAEVMYQHLHLLLPLEELQHVSQPVVSLVESLLDKNPARRPQSPSELHTLLLEVRAALDPKGQLESRDVIRGAAEHVREDRNFANGWRPSTEPWDFKPFLVGKLKAFTGRQWLFEEIDEWRATGSEPALLIIGEPGVGKSSIVAALVDKNPEGQVLAYHCCRADTPATLEPAAFVRSLAAMLSSQLDGYAAMLQGAVIVDVLQFAETDPASAFESAILGPLHKLQQPERGRRYLLIDALDEALMRTRRPTIVDLLSARLNLLPPWLRIVATTRSEPSVLSQLGSLRAHTLSAQDPRNQDDVRNFIHHRLAEPALRDKAGASAKTLRELASTLLRSSAGNFLFVTTALDAVESGQFGFDQIAQLPLGLSSLYELFFNRLFRDAGVDFGCSRPVLETVAGAGEPLTRKDIAAATGLDPEEQLPPILARLASFVPHCEGRYAFFHKSVFDWLTGWDLQHDQPVAGLYHVSLEKGRTRLADWCWTAYRREPSKVPLYALRHLPGHLHQVGRTQEARAVLLDFEFIRAKLEVTDASALLADYEYLPEGADLRLVQSAIRLSAHVLTRDHRQLAGQLTGRLLGNSEPNIQALLKGAAESKAWPWLRPLTPSLAPPGGPLIRTFAGHTSWVHMVKLTPDGRRAISSSGDETLRVWDLESNQSARIFVGHTAPVSAVVILPNGRRAVSASSDCTLRVWDLESGKSLRTLEGHDNPVFVVAITPDGRYAVSASAVRTQRVWTGKRGERIKIASVLASPDRGLRVWDLESGELVHTLEGHTDWVNAVVVTPSSHCAISASSDHTLRVWDLESGRSVHTLAGHADAVNAVAVTPDGHCAVSASSDYTLRVWDLESGQTIRTLAGHTGCVTAVVLTPDGRSAISGSADHTLRIWDLARGQSIRTLEGHTNSVTAVELTPDGCRAISGSPDHTLRVWDLNSGQSVGTLAGHTDWVTAVAVTRDGRYAISGSADHTLRMWDLQRRQSPHTVVGQTDSITAVVLMPDGRRAALASDYHLLRMWDLENGKLLRALAGHADWVTAIAVTPDGCRAVSASADHTLQVWDLESGQSIRVLRGHTDLVSAVAVTPDGLCVISASADHTLRIWDLESGQSVRTLSCHADLVSAVAVTQDRQCAIWGSDLGALLVWESEPGETVRFLAGHTDWVTAIAVTRDAHSAVSASADGTLRVWDLDSAHSVGTLEGHTDLVNALALTPDGRHIISASADHTLRVWDVDTGNYITAFTGEGPMMRCAVAPDGRTIIAREKSGRGHLLRLDGVDLTAHHVVPGSEY